MPVFRDDQVLVIAPGSATTLVQYGLGESLGPASHEIPTRVYRPNKNEDYFTSRGEEDDAVYPLKGGTIVDQAAFNYFIKLVYKSIVRPGYPTALLVVGSARWTRPQVECLTQYIFETIRVPGFALLPSGLAVAFAFALQDALIIDIGQDKTEITPVLEFSVVSQAQRVVDVGGSFINQHITQHLPDLMAQQVEDLKRSPIYEVLSEDDTKNSWFGQQENSNPEEDGVIDVAAIVASGRTREILAERERQKHNSGGKQEPSNMDREFNSFTDSSGKRIEVGKQRFHGTEPLVERITLEVGKVMQKIDQVNRRQDLWDNLVIVGRGSCVKGLKDAILSSLSTRYLINRPTTYSELPSTFNTGHNTPLTGGTPIYNGVGGGGANMQLAHQGHGQSPTSIRPAKLPEYFPEWKGRGWEDSVILGAQIAARPIFTGSVENTFVSKNDYNEVGPTAIWDIGV